MNERISWVRLEEISSTNDYAKQRRAEKKDTAVLAYRQTGGRGTKGRSFSSEKGGVYLSLLRFYDNFPANAGFSIMVSGAVAVCRVLAGYGVTPKIKWPNDIHVGGKKICGILIENQLSGDTIRSSIVGIGLNVYNPLPAQLKEIATTLQAEIGRKISVDEVAARLVDELYAGASMAEYRRYLGYVGERVEILTAAERREAILLGVTDEGRLEAEIDGEKKVLSSGEVSLRV